MPKYRLIGDLNIPAEASPVRNPAQRGHWLGYRPKAAVLSSCNLRMIIKYYREKKVSDRITQSRLKNNYSIEEMLRNVL